MACSDRALRSSDLPAALIWSSSAAAKLAGSTSASDRNVSVRCTPLIWKISAEQQLAQVRVIPDPEPDQQVQAARDHAHVLGLGQRPDRA